MIAGKSPPQATVGPLLCPQFVSRVYCVPAIFPQVWPNLWLWSRCQEHSEVESERGAYLPGGTHCCSSWARHDVRISCRALQTWVETWTSGGAIIWKSLDKRRYFIFLPVVPFALGAHTKFDSACALLVANGPLIAGGSWYLQRDQGLLSTMASRCSSIMEQVH